LLPSKTEKTLLFFIAATGLLLFLARLYFFLWIANGERARNWIIFVGERYAKQNLTRTQKRGFNRQR
jgi:hypothetical protein